MENLYMKGKTSQNRKLSKVYIFKMYLWEISLSVTFCFLLNRIFAPAVLVATFSYDIHIPVVSSQVLSDQEEFDKADKYFQKATEVEPENATVYVHRGTQRFLLEIQFYPSMNERIAVSYIVIRRQEESVYISECSMI